MWVLNAEKTNPEGYQSNGGAGATIWLPSKDLRCLRAIKWRVIAASWTEFLLFSLVVLIDGSQCFSWHLLLMYYGFSWQIIKGEFILFVCQGRNATVFLILIMPEFSVTEFLVWIKGKLNLRIISKILSKRGLCHLIRFCEMSEKRLLFIQHDQFFFVHV